MLGLTLGHKTYSKCAVRVWDREPEDSITRCECAGRKSYDSVCYEENSEVIAVFLSEQDSSIF